MLLYCYNKIDLFLQIPDQTIDHSGGQIIMLRGV